MMQNKVVTLCGSMKFQNEMIAIATKLEIENSFVVLQPVYNLSNVNYDKKKIDILSQIHFKRIELSDAIYVLNIDGYIGDATKREIEYAKRLNKEIIYYQ